MYTNKFMQTYINILKQSKIANYIMQQFDIACSYFNFLTQTNIDSYQWINGNTTGFKLVVTNNYEYIQIQLFYNNNIIQKQKLDIIQCSENLHNQIANFIRLFLNNIYNKINQQNIIKLDIDKLMACIA